MVDTHSTPTPPKFYGRERELDLIVTPDAKAPVLMLYGVRGIGKTRLIEEAIQQLRSPRPRVGRAVTFLVDCEKLKQLPTPDALLQTIITQGNQVLSGSWRSAEQAAHEIVRQLAQLAAGGGVYLFFDTTEALQSEEQFWRWLESNLVGPLIPAQEVRFVFAGRVPAPWRSYEIRRALRNHSLAPLPREDAALALLRDCLLLYNDQLEGPTIEAALPLLYEMSRGHPGLSEQLAQAAAPLLPEMESHPDELERELRASVVQPFIERDLFGGLVEPWPEILTWASVLEDFDAYTLEQYVYRLPSLRARMSGVPAYFYNRGIAEMRNQHALVWHSGQGYSLHGVLREIVSRQFEKSHNEQYEKARQAAGATYAMFAESLQGQPEADRYLEKAAQYGHEIDSPTKEQVQ